MAETDALRSLLASFVIEVDKAGELAKGNAAVDAMKQRLADLQAEFAKVRAPAAKAASDIESVFTRAAQTAAKNLKAISAVAAFGGGQGGSGWGDALAAAAKGKSHLATVQGMSGRADNSNAWGGLGALRDGIGPQMGPTRDTLNAGRAQMAESERAAAAYALTLRGRLATAVQHVRDGFAGGPKAQGPGLITTLATARNAFLAFAGGTAVRGVMHLVDSIGDISESSARLGVTTDQFQRLRVVADQNGTSVEALGTAFRTLSNAAVQPTKETTKAFDTLGLSVKDADGNFKSANDLFFEVARALAGVENETQRSALAQDLLGRSAQQLKPIFAGGTAAVDEMSASLSGMNVLSADTIKQADELSDKWKTVGPAFLAAAEPLLKMLLPALETLTEWIVKGVDIIGKWVAQTDFASIALTALGAVMVTRVIPGLQLMVGLGGGASRVLLNMAGSAAKAAIAFLRVALPLLAIEDFITFLRGGDSETGRLLDAVFGKGSADGTLKAIRDVTEAIKSLWNWITGNGKGEQWFGMWREFTDGLKLIANDLAAAAGLGGPQFTGGLNNGAIFRGSDFSGQTFDGATATMPLPAGQYGPPTAAQAAGATVDASGDRVVNITLPPGSGAQEIGRVTAGALEADRLRIMAGF